MLKLLLLVAASLSLVFELDTVGIDFDDLKTLISAKSNPPPSAVGNLDILVDFESIPFHEPTSNKVVIISGATVITIFCVSLLYSVGDSFGYDQNTPPRAKTE
ncbi:hypothetical protein HDV01_003571 [Terramyces sp. JEL0728]|nr:hypothetical protein HDV01_003571 [Terramyces sp. JEL0728]